jgi:hypothetical protein
MEQTERRAGMRYALLDRILVELALEGRIDLLFSPHHEYRENRAYYSPSSIIDLEF